MELGTLIVLVNALILGIRHGIDWDHIAAITDIVGTSTNTGIEHGGILVSGQRTALRLSSFYALGHAAIVLALGIAALLFAAVLPAWIDPLMQRVVGMTLLFLSAWIFYSLLKNSAESETFVVQSRWMFLFARLSEARNYLHSKFTGKAQKTEVRSTPYGAAAAFGIGIIHGFGAETGTQVLLIAAVGGAANHRLGICILLSFIMGLLASNLLVAILTCAGFAGSAKFKPLLLLTGTLTGFFSLVVGTLFVSGCGSLLPDL